VLTGIYPGVSIDEVRDRTGWPLEVSADLSELAPPCAAELAALRELLAAPSRPAPAQPVPPQPGEPAVTAPIAERTGS
jgi:hypothetical protein